MKIILLTGGLYSIPVIHYLSAQKLLHSIVSPGKANKNNIPIELNAQHLNIPFKRFLKEELNIGFKDWLTEAQVDAVFVFGCPYKISPTLTALPKFGFFNIHFSLLPAYRGKSPVFWQIKNGAQTGGITIHQVTENYDDGPMLMQHEISIAQGESLGLYTNRLAMESVQVISKGIEKLNTTGNDLLFPQNENNASYFAAPVIDDLKIDWETQSANEIENLVNATNPDYGGAVTQFRGLPFRILEVNLVQVNNPSTFIPGSIVHSDVNYGVIVACKETQFLRLNVVQFTEGIFSGFKLAALGIAAGEHFENAANLSGLTINS
ncbi:methionyl-tRNA formyltransferase [Mucilaginibacter xinganensis]|uniref:Formyl transferase n=1 Tax=Mucilaginibacter xinganensis TaxID=1234841 RepID=A0A223NWN1_9SPHI|nr:formyltransferase family protein [Mucilaginibacter xinganensis]ASU34277.1 formyl transferase [Mucilaginibacter xinganensis]